ncbi:DUF3304 domain-containing protein [Burkholderia pseudomultivorans]|uniref:DUF3304 domain-containing protein n=1 Tax=Burkholderia pseudomultivorans TaxID=1207504 RepID=UPI000AC976C1
MCCISIPAHWRPGMKLVVKWNVDKVLDGKHLGTWYTATTEVPPYGPRIAGFVVNFLSGDRIRIQIRDEKGILPKIDDDDPYIVQGVLDSELNNKRGGAMSVIRWPEPFNERLVESKIDKATGKSALADGSVAARRRYGSSLSLINKRRFT